MKPLSARIIHRRRRGRWARQLAIGVTVSAVAALGLSPLVTAGHPAGRVVLADVSSKVPITSARPAAFYGPVDDAALTQPVTQITATPDGAGYWLLTPDGGVFSFGDAHFYGSTGGMHLNQPIVGMASTPDGRGYWLVASDGGMFSFGDAHFYGSTGGMHLNQPIVGMASTPDGRGYWLVASDGGMFSFGDAHFYGSTGGMHLNQPIVGMVSTPDGRGYWLVASDGGMFSFGDAAFYGSTGAVHLNEPIVGMASTPDGRGYWLVASDGGMFSFGDAAFDGSTGSVHLAKPIVGMASGPAVAGYWLASSDGSVFTFPASVTSSPVKHPPILPIRPPPTTPPTQPPTTPTTPPPTTTTTQPPPTTTTTQPPPTTTTAPPTGPTGPTFTVPSTVPADCSSDVTAWFNVFFAGLPDGAVVSLPAGACYLVSNSPESVLLIQGTTGVTIQGNGATFEQTAYACDASPQPIQPVLDVKGNSNLAVAGITVKGPSTCGGSSNEGDYGIVVEDANHGVTFSGVTIEDTDGDGLAVYPHLESNTGINTNVTFKDGTFSNIGYHGVTPEGVNGLSILDNTFNGVGNFMDLEVDAPCTPSCYDPSGNPVGAAQWNVSVIGNVFKDGTGGNWIESEQAECIPQRNVLIEGNTLDTTVSSHIVFTGSVSTSCPVNSGLQILDNVATSAPESTGSIVSPPGSALVSVSDYTGVMVSGNRFAAADGYAGYYPNTPWIPGVDLCGVSASSVVHNTFKNALVPYQTTGCFLPSGPDSAITACDNTYGLTVPIASTRMAAPAADPKDDGPCSAGA